MLLRSVVVAVVTLAFTAPAIAQSIQTGKPLLVGVDNSQPTAAPAVDLTVLENKLGIGTATPAFKLDVVGQINGSGGLCIGGDCRSTWPAAGGASPWTVSGTTVLYNAGNVGVGTSSPAFKLDVTGQVNAASGVCIAGDCKTSWPAFTNPWTTSGANLNYTAGNVGLGTTSPGARLDVASGHVYVSSNNYGVIFKGNGGTGIFTSAGGNTLNFATNDVANRMAIDASGNVGVGTTTPQSRIDVVGTSNTNPALVVTGGTFAAGKGVPVVSLGFSQSTYTAGQRMLATIEAQGGDGTYADRGQLAFKTGYLGGTGSLSQKMVLDFNGNLGIGTTAPMTTLDVAGYLSVRSGGRLRLPTSTFANFAEIYSPTNEGTGASPMAFNVGAGEALRITNTANVGIGTASPTHKLHVIGNVRVEGNISALYQDVAEWVEADEPIAAATVVIAAADRVNRVQMSIGAYDTAVTGVVSAQPGLLLGEEAPGKVAVAQSGRVRVKVDASYGAIRAGDLLVTSPVAGYAMRSQPVMLGDVPIHRPGTILGKALEPLAGGRGRNPGAAHPAVSDLLLATTLTTV